MAITAPFAARRAAPSTGRFYRPELDALRLVAFAMVFLHHALPEGGGGYFTAWRTSLATGVCLFFLLSAYLITQLLELEEERIGKIQLRAFYTRRVLRIWPLYFLITFGDFLWPHQYANHQFSLSRLAANIFLAGNWYAYFHHLPASFSAPLWSISVEEQFYLLWPAIRKFLGRAGAAIWSVAMLAISYAVLWYLCHIGADATEKIWVNSFVQFQFFSSGALLAFSVRSRVPGWGWAARAGIAASGGILFFLAQALFGVKSPSYTAIPFGHAASGYLLINLGCVLLFTAFLGMLADPKSRVVYLGKISYGLYAFHGFALAVTSKIVREGLVLWYPRLRPAVDPFVIVLGASLTVVIALLSYRFFEMPFLRLKHHFEKIRSRPD